MLRPMSGIMSPGNVRNSRNKLQKLLTTSNYSSFLPSTISIFCFYYDFNVLVFPLNLVLSPPHYSQFYSFQQYGIFGNNCNKINNVTNPGDCLADSKYKNKYINMFYCFIFLMFMTETGRHLFKRYFI